MCQPDVVSVSCLHFLVWVDVGLGIRGAAITSGLQITA